MGSSSSTPQVHVFLSYRRMDNPKQGAYDGRVTMFRDALRTEISAVIGAENTTVFMDTDPETMIGDKTWQDKILKQLAVTTVFVSIMTANYLESREGHACSWEFAEYVKLYDADHARHSMIAIQLCDPDIAQPILASGVWSSLGRQEIIEYETCRDAWREGPGHASWGNLVGKVADAVIAFTKNAQPKANHSDPPIPNVPVKSPYGGGRYIAVVLQMAVWGMWGWSMASVKDDLLWLIGCIGFGLLAGIAAFFYLIDSLRYQEWFILAGVLSNTGGVLLAIGHGLSFHDVRWWMPSLSAWTWLACSTAAVLWILQFFLLHHASILWKRSNNQNATQQEMKSS